MNEGVLSFDRTLAIWAAMWDERNKAKTLLDEKAFRAKDENLGLSILFFLRNYTDPGFHRFVNKETNYLNGKQPKGKVIREHLVILTKFVLLDNLRLDENKYSTLDDVERVRKAGIKSARDSKYEGGIPGYKHLQRLVREYYPEVIKYPIRWSRKIQSDQRFKAFETTFTKKETEEHVKKFQEAMSHYQLPLPPHHALELNRVSEIATTLRNFDPQDLAKRAVYRRDVEQAIKKELPREIIDDGRRSSWMVKQFESYGYGVQAIFQELRWYVELKWFQRRPLKRKLAMLKTKASYEFSAEDAKRGIHLASEWFSDDSFVFRQVVPVTDAFRLIGKPKASEFLYRECLRQLRLDEVDQTLCVEDLAHVARWQGRTDEAIQGLEEALRRWEKLGPKHIGDRTLQHAYLAQLYRKKGELKLADKHKKSLIELIPQIKSKGSPAYMSHFFLNHADIADEYEDYSFETSLLIQGIEITWQDDNLSEYALYFEQCIADIEKDGMRQDWSRELGRFPHPADGQWKIERLSSHFSEFKV